MSLIIDHALLKRYHHEFFFHLDVPIGTFSLILGESRSGKTSLLNTIAGLEPITQGKILFNDTLIHSLPPAERPLTFLFQDTSLFPNLNVWENIALGIKGTLTLSERERNTVDSVVRALKLEPIQHELSSALPRGKHQLTALGRSLLRQCPILLLDEPLEYLSPEEECQIMGFLLHVHKTMGLTTLMATNRIHPAWAQNMGIIFLSRCQILAQGTWHEVWENSHGDVQEFYKKWIAPLPKTDSYEYRNYYDALEKVPL